MLTAKKEKFVLGWIESGNKSDSYTDAFDTSRMKRESVHKRAYELSNDPEVMARYKEIMANVQDETETTVALIDSYYKSAYQLAKEQENPSGMIAAGAALAKLHGLNFDKSDSRDSVTTIYNQVVVADRSMIPPMPTVGDAYHKHQNQIDEKIIFQD